MRGLARSAGHWGDFVDRLRAVCPGDELAAADLPGSGTRRGEPVPLTVAGHLAVVREAVGGGARRGGGLWLLGLSMGGMVAYEWARRYPAEVAGVVLVNTSLGGFSPPWRRMRPSGALQVLAAFVTRDVAARERRIFALTSHHPELAEAAVPRWIAIAREAPVRRMSVLRQLLAAATYRPGLSAPGGPPFLILNGRRDRLVHPSCSRAVALGTPDAVLAEHPGAGHDLPLDDPDWVAGEISAWLPRRDRTKLLQF